MNYRHAFHAGNFADVFKHAVLAALLARLREKADAPLSYLDTHAAIGLYDLSSDEAQRTGEFRHGILRLLARPDLPAALAPYLALVRRINPGLAANGANLTRYPGSPAIAEAMLGPDDRLVLNELHPEDYRALRARYGRDPRITFHQRDGFEAMKALLPPNPKRGLVLIDPAFEAPDEFAQLGAAIVAAQRKWTTGIIAAWYPLKDLAAVAALKASIASCGARSALAAEFAVQADTESARLNGCGLIITNPPWQFDETLRTLLPALLDALGRGRGARQAVGWLIPPR